MASKNLDAALELFKRIPLEHPTGFDEKCEKLWDYYNGEHDKHIAPMLAKMYPKATQGGMAVVSKPQAKRMTDTTATLFHRPPIEHLYQVKAPWWRPSKEREVALGPETQDRRVWQHIDESTHKNSRMKFAQRQARILKTVGVMPAWKEDHLHFETHRPSKIFYLADPDNPYDPKSLQAVATASGRGWMMWSRKLYAYVVETEEGSGVYEALDPLGTDFVNPYGIIPLVLFHDSPGDYILAPLDDTITSSQETVDKLWSVFSWSMGNGFTMNVAYTNADLSGFVAGPDQVAVIPDPGAKMDRLSANLDPKGMVEFVSSMTKTDAVMHAADPGLFSLDSDHFMNALSGVAKQVDRMDLVSIREDAEQDWAYGLAELFDKTRAVWNFHNKNRQISKEVIYRVEWQEPEPAQNVLQEAQAEELRIQNKTSTPEEIRARRENKAVEDA